MRAREREFQSTSPVRGTTIYRIRTETRADNFNPRPPCGGRRDGSVSENVQMTISIHVPRAGDDNNGRPPCGGRRKSFPKCLFSMCDNNGRPPCGGRHALAYIPFRQQIQQWSSPMRGTTVYIAVINYTSNNNNGRPPCGGRQQNRTIFQVIATRFALLFTNRIIKSDFILSLYPIFLHFSSANPCLFYKQHPLRTIIKSDFPQGHMILSSHIVRFLKNISFRDYRFVCCPFLHP